MYTRVYTLKISPRDVHFCSLLVPLSGITNGENHHLCNRDSSAYQIIKKGGTEPELNPAFCVYFNHPVIQVPAYPEDSWLSRIRNL